MAAVFTELFRVAPDDLDSLTDPELEPNPDTSIWLRGLGDLELVGYGNYFLGLSPPEH